MSLKQKRLLWFFVWLLIVLLGPITVFLNTPISKIFSDYLVLLNTFQRITGLLAFSLLFVQLMLGGFMDRWVQFLGAKAYRVHVTQGLITYGFIFAHPIFNTIITYERVGALSSVLSILPNFSTQREIYLSFGRIAFTLLSIGVIAAYFRTKPFFRRNWRAFHIINYLAFFLTLVHSRGVGTDIRTPPFAWLYWIAVVGVTFTVLYRFAWPLVRRLPLSGALIKKARGV